MIRATEHLSAALVTALLLSAGLAACDDDEEEPIIADAAVDAAPGDAAVADAAPDAGLDAAVIACDPAVLTTRSGVHNAGADCSACHRPGGSAPTWTVAGTIYTDTAGTAPLPGATIHVIDAAGQEILLISALNGNFWTNQALVTPVTTFASRCPDTAAMTASVANPQACNSCHGPGFRISLP